MTIFGTKCQYIMKESTWKPMVLWAVFLCLPLQAMGNKLPWEEYNKLISARGQVDGLGPDLFGDQVSLYNTALSFSLTDIELPGHHGLPVALTRTFAVTSKPTNVPKDLPMGDWNLDLPRIEGVFAATSSNPTWQNNRCTGSGAPPSVTVAGFTGDDDEADEDEDAGGQRAATYTANQYWHGTFAHLPGGGELIRANRGAQKPTASGDWRWMTAGFTYFRCLSSIQNGAGEGFVAMTADGTQYTFNRMAQYYAEPLQGVESGPPWTAAPLPRKRNVLYATRVEDRFGNYVNYTYTNSSNQPARLTRIEASDGRTITLSWSNNRVVSASDGTQTWTYGYSSAGNLNQVNLPDGSSWTINFAGLWNVELRYDGNFIRSCEVTGLVIGLYRGGVGTVTHPSGAVGRFEVGPVLAGRSNVPKACHNWTYPNNPENDVAQWPRYYDLLGLKKKRVTGPGLSTMEWTYATGSDSSWAAGTGSGAGCGNQPGCDQPVCVSDSCAGTARTTVSGPNNEWTRYTFGNSYRYNEGKLTKIERGTSASNILRTETIAYELRQSGRPYPVPVGTSPNNRGDVFAAAHLAPRKQRTIRQQNTDFRYIVNTFDSFARPLNIKRENSQGESRTEVTTYHDNLSRWVLGQVARLTAGGLIAEETTYNATWAVPLVSKRFGKTVQTLGWDTSSSVASGQRGTLRTVRDGNNNTTTLTSWRRGIPRNIAYADGRSQSAVVNNNGTIASVTDENGYKTCYAYDPMGRLSRITYPSQTQAGVCDTSTWNRTTQVFEQRDTGGYGIPAGYWRQSVRTGNGQKFVYYDALWRPRIVREYDTTNQSATQRFTRFEYDHEGRTTYASYPSTSSSAATGVRTTYDVLGRVTRVREDSELGVLTTATAYLRNSLGYYTRITNPRGQITRTWFQGFDQPDYETPLLIEYPEGAYTLFARNNLGQTQWMQRQSLDGRSVDELTWDQLYSRGASVQATRHYVYNSARELCKLVEPESLATIMAYDGAGNLAWSKSGSTYISLTNCNTGNIPVAERTLRLYDARNRITTLSFPDGRGDTTYTYTPDGLLRTLTAANGNGVTTTYSYNRRRLLIRERMAYGGTSIDWELRYNYNANGHVSSHGYPGSGSVGYSPNALGQPTRVGARATNATYHPNGALKSYTFANGIVHTLTQNTRGLPDRSRHSYGSTRYVDLGYDYDANGNVAAISDGATGQNGRGNRDMVYDGLDRLTRVTSPMWGNAYYDYDALDNLTRVRLTTGAGARNHYLCYASNTNRLATVRTGSCSGNTVYALSYDDQGNLVSKGGTTYDFDYGNRLRRASGGGVATTTYLYDGHGRRIRDRTGGASRYSMYDASGKLRHSRDLRTGIRSNYFYLGNTLVSLLERDANNTVLGHKYQHTDALGSLVAVTNGSRTVIERSEYEPYGQVLNRPLRDNPGYTGHVEDQATGLNYMQQRYYDPQIGRFISTDPVGADPESGGNFNRYWYGNNNPYTNLDPDGRRCVVANRGSTYCLRRDIYRVFDRNVSHSTRFFGAAALTVEYLASSDIPVFGRLGPSSEATQFLRQVSRELYTLNARTYAGILDGTVAGPRLDSRLVHMEQTMVQTNLDALPAGQRSRIIDSINESFSRRWLGNLNTQDRSYNRVLDGVEKNLGRSIDFGNQSDRETIGNALINDLRRSGACTSTGTRIKSC